MFGIKTKLLSIRTHYVKKYLTSHHFPQKGLKPLLLKACISEIRNEYSRQSIKNNLGWLHTTPNPTSVWAWKKLLEINPNHLGNWTVSHSNPFGTQKLENAAIRMLIDLYNGNQRNLEGYITTGGTEGNLFSVWIGKKYLKSVCKLNSICLIRTELTHYSVRKSADIAEIKEYIIPLNPEFWNMDITGFSETITRLYKHGFRGFLIPITLGYTQTGTSDDITLLAKTINQLKRKYTDIHFFVWLDAAINGLVIPFLTMTFSPFSQSLIQTVVVDFHKLGGVPYPAGVILYRKNLRKFIEKIIDYLPEKDTTVLGSRPGAAAASIWAIITSLGKHGFIAIIKKQFEIKKSFLKQIHLLFPQAQVITYPQSLTCGIVFHFLKNGKISKYISQKYGLYPTTVHYHFYPSTKQKFTLYKFYFLPNTTQDIINNFLFRSIIIYKETKYKSDVIRIRIRRTLGNCLS